MSRIFAQNLKYYREQLRMTQSDLATSTGLSRSAINNYEREQSEPTFDALCHIADVLGVELTDLVKEHDEYPTYIRRMQVTDDESALLQAYREADPVYQTVALDILRTHRRAD